MGSQKLKMMVVLSGLFFGFLSAKASDQISEISNIYGRQVLPDGKLSNAYYGVSGPKSGMILGSEEENQIAYYSFSGPKAGIVVLDEGIY